MVSEARKKAVAEGLVISLFGLSVFLIVWPAGFLAIKYLYHMETVVSAQYSCALAGISYMAFLIYETWRQITGRPIVSGRAVAAILK